ncbi:helix-turn-helix domain-containing protein [uncultured Sulfitobacter sp.]|uniref:helix-turn-helix domain-containing protein n=1 Tax=uncultured Sulfitobacter sp. TaxID=191468 RepID=UPI00345DA010
MDVFCRSLRSRAKALGISNAEAARRCGLSERRYAHYVSGDREPDLGTLVRIATALGTTPNQLLGLGEIQDTSSRDILFQRIQSAVQVISDEALEIATVQMEALAAKRL